jgi:tripartite-type tricarboxylate transporter receptor subunit TctC
MAQQLSPMLGQQFIIEHRPGAGSNLAAEYVVRSPADGYTLFMGTSANTINATFSPNLSFDFGKDLAPIALLASVPNVLAADPALGVTNVREFIAAAKAKPGQLSYATSGVGSLAHMSGELLSFLTGIKLVHVPYPGSAQALTDVLAGRVSAVFAPINIAGPHIAAGKLTALALTANKRSAMASDLPTIAEAAGLPGYDAAIWYGLMAPARTPAPALVKLATAIHTALQSKETRDLINKQSMDVLDGSPEAFARYINADTKRWAELIKDAGLKR